MHELLRSTAREMVRHPRGILAADESTKTMTARLEAVGLASTAESRLAWRETIVRAPRLSDHVAGVILYDETLRARASDGRPFGDLVEASGLLPGIKVDTGTTLLAGTHPELVTEGLDGLGARVVEYMALGARFAKWRAVFRIGERTPSPMAIRANVSALARYARLCQETGLVPIVEPEVLMEGSHTLETALAVDARVLAALFDELRAYDVDLGAMVLKPAMVTPGVGGPPATPKEVAEATLGCFLDHVPASVAGIALLSGGQSDETATERLAAINPLGHRPWPITYSFGRALLDTPVGVYARSGGDQASTQAALIARVRECSAALRPIPDRP